MRLDKIENGFQCHKCGKPARIRALFMGTIIFLCSRQCAKILSMENDGWRVIIIDRSAGKEIEKRPEYLELLKHQSLKAFKWSNE